MRRWLLALTMVLGCGDSPVAIIDATISDGGGDGVVEPDARAIDAAIDGPDLDAATVDAAIDGPDVDATALDATVDAGTVDAATVDAGTVDAAIDGPDVDATALDATALDGTVLDAAAGVPDPAPGFDAPGEYTTPGCADSNQTNFTLAVGAASAYTFSGTITGASGDGTFWVRGPGGETVGGPIETAADGRYAKTLPIFCGANLVKLVWNTGSCPLVLVYAVTRTTCEPADITATVQWDDLGRDWELHLVKPGGHINDDATDCTWTSCIGGSPDWGAVGDPSDNPHKDIDNTGAYGPENIWLANPEPGIYTVLVEHWGSSGSALSDGFVTLNVAGHTVTVEITDLPPLAVWTAATIAWPSGIVTTGTAIYDCSGTWSLGCRAVLP